MSTRRGGFISLYRQIEDWEWYRNHVVKDVFIDLLICASYQENTVEGRTIKVGQVVTSYERIARRTGYTVKQVRLAFDKLKKSGEIRTERASRFSIVTLVNWDKFQYTEEKRASQRADKGQSESNQRADKGQHYNNINNSSEKEEKRNNGASPTSLSSSMTKEEYDAWWRDATE